MVEHFFDEASFCQSTEFARRAEMKQRREPGTKQYFQTFLLELMLFDLRVLIIFKRLSRTVATLLKAMLRIIAVIALAAGLFSYARPNFKLEITTLDGTSDRAISFERYGVTSYDDKGSSRIYRNPSCFEQVEEINDLKNTAANLANAIRRMSSEMRDIQARDRLKGDEDSPDFASEAAGGSILDTPNTVSYFEPKAGQLTLFGIPVCKQNYFTPRKVIQPWSQAGECWAFGGDRGSVKIALAHAALIDRVTLEHIPVSVSLTGKIDSAPRDFRVTAIFHDGSITLGAFVYDSFGPPSQTFRLTEERLKDIPIKIVMLEVRSNWGHPNYTCIYRFRVHGRISNS